MTAVAGRRLDVGGPDIVSYGELIDAHRRPHARRPPGAEVQAAHGDAHRQPGRRGHRRRGVASSIGPLMESLDTDLVPADDQRGAALGVRLHPLNAAIEHALAEWERDEPLAAR